MRKEKSEIHDFHMVLTNDIKDKIDILSKRLKKSKSKTAIYIIDKSLNNFKMKCFFEEESNEFTKYQNINWDQELHIYFDKKMFRKIKYFANINYVYSLGILLRWLFDYFFSNLYDEKNNIEFSNKIEKVRKEIDKYEKTIKCWLKISEIKQLSGEKFCQLTFNENFSVIGFNFDNST